LLKEAGLVDGARKNIAYKFLCVVFSFILFQTVLDCSVFAEDYKTIFKEVDMADVVESAQSSVVLVKVIYKATEKEPASSRDQIFKHFFDDDFFFQYPDENPSVSTATGFLINKEGYILTNQHLVGQSSSIERIEVTMLGEDTPLVAKLIGQDYVLDLAILKIDVKRTLPSLTLGDSDSMRIGDTVVAIGNPYGYDHTVTKGVLSAKGREIIIPDTTLGTIRTYKNLLQTDAAINPGNSGGPLINAAGEAIGINTAVSLQAQGIGFAIPINVAKDVIDQLISVGKVLRPYVGIIYSDISSTVAIRYKLKDTVGVYVEWVEPDSPAERAGLQAGDRIRKIGDGKTDVIIKDMEHFSDIIDKLAIGERCLFTVTRDGKTSFITVILGERKADQ
jgi:serine protease Do